MPDTQEFDPGSPGASAHRQAERARDPKSWTTGAKGEEILAESLTHRCPDVPVLHDRRLPGTRTNVDHIAVAASGVYVIDAKRYRGKVEIERPFFGKSKLKIAGRDRTALVAGLAKQVAAVEAVVAAVAPDVPIHGCFCFIEPQGPLSDTGVPLLRTLRINGFPLFYRRKLAKQLNRPGALSAERARAVALELARRFPAA